MHFRLSRRRTTVLLAAVATAAVPLLTSGPAGVAQAAPAQVDGTSAAAVHGWAGALVQEDNFDGTSLSGDWGAYDGPGHAGNGVRSPGQISVANGVMHMQGTANGTTAGMAWANGQQYGRWETRAKYTAGTSAYHQVLILWPDAEDFPVGGEVDYSEVSDSSRQKMDFFLHYGADNSQVHGETTVDMTQWHNYAVEWTPEHIIGFVDGKEFYRSEDPKTLPPRPMHATIQLDWFPDDGPSGEGALDVDWIRQYGL